MALSSLVVQASTTSIPFAELLPTPITSGCFLTANSSRLPQSALQTPPFSTQLLSALVEKPLRLDGQG